jgi:chaperonin GroES
MVEQGMKVYSNIFKRIWRGMKQEFKKLYELNAVYLPVTKRFGEEGLIAQQSDFISGSSNITPVADPNITSESMRLSQAQAVKQAAMMTPGYSIPEVEMEYLRALRVESPERLYPGPDKVPPLPNPKVQVEQMKMQGQQAALQQKQQQFLLTLQEEHRLNTAKMVQLEAQGHMFLANAQGAEAGHQIAAFNAAIGAAKSHNEHLRAMIELIQKGMRDEQSSTPPGQPGSMGGLEAPPGNEGTPGMGGQMAQ